MICMTESQHIAQWKWCSHAYLFWLLSTLIKVMTYFEMPTSTVHLCVTFCNILLCATLSPSRLPTTIKVLSYKVYILRKCLKSMNFYTTNCFLLHLICSIKIRSTNSHSGVKSIHTEMRIKSNPTVWINTYISK